MIIFKSFWYSWQGPDVTPRSSYPRIREIRYVRSTEPKSGRWSRDPIKVLKTDMSLWLMRTTGGERIRHQECSNIAVECHIKVTFASFSLNRSFSGTCVKYFMRRARKGEPLKRFFYEWMKIPPEAICQERERCAMKAHNLGRLVAIRFFVCFQRQNLDHWHDILIAWKVICYEWKTCRTPKYHLMKFGDSAVPKNRKVIYSTFTVAGWRGFDFESEVSATKHRCLLKCEYFFICILVDMVRSWCKILKFLFSKSGLHMVWS